MTALSQLAKSKLLSCPACNGPVEVKSRHVAIAGTTVLVYCSAECLRIRVPPPPEAPPAAAPPAPRWGWWLAGDAVLSALCLVMFGVGARAESADPVPVPAFHAAVETTQPIVEAARDPELAREEEDALLAELGRDAWLHPLGGPNRRMPVNHNGAFGAVRPGDRPPECLSGHCGVDVGHVWGEPIHAVHGGVVEWVNRGPNEDRGGIFVKLAHREGTLFSWYFHLAAVPRWVQPGAKVAAGQVIGLLGDTGVKHSAPHLHFALSVKIAKNRERYLDPEPLLAIWPLWIRDREAANRGQLSTAIEPGVPVRERPRAKRRRARAEPAPVDTAASVPAVIEEATPASLTVEAAP